MHLAEALLALWIASELVIRFRQRFGERSPSDRGSLRILWIEMVAGCGLGFALKSVEGWSFPWSARASHFGGCALITIGLVVRWWAVIVLGRFFAPDVRIQAGHELITRGPYARVRHPSYSGLILVLVGLCALFGSWLSTACILALTVPPLLWRIAIEEEALAAAFGAQWTEYARRTKRLVPFLV
ncbi:MAG: isoprenylcysteine carboxylmethyltransferase family protein [Planctomycetes bacterium]|nr:isoprenylcysteine carboxylmethyltransferase family protein [Planctomycetota bacterium]